MARKKFENVDEYIESFPAEIKEILQKLRTSIKKESPSSVTEAISYGIPTFKLNGKYVIYFAGFRDHVSIYPAPRGEKEFAKELSKYKGGKGTVQFPLDKPLPMDLIKRIVKFRLRISE